jgi:DNA-binding NarL/FixJ family response regulator
MDYNLEEANGVDLAITMQQQGLDAKFILLTGDLQESMIDVAMQAGFHEVLEKPVSQEKIKEIFSNT